MSELATSVSIQFFLILCRIGACFMILPGFGSARVSPQVRMLLVVAMTAALVPMIETNYLRSEPLSDTDLLRGIVVEVTIGLVIGFSVRLFLAALEWIASAVALSIGFGGGMDTSLIADEPQAALGNLISLSALTLLFVLDFHHHVIVALVGSYELLPLLEMPSAEAVVSRIVNQATDNFLFALRLGSPFIAYGIIVNLMVGLLNKLVVQIPVYFIALPAVLLGGLVLLAITISPMLASFGNEMPQLILYR